MFKKLRYVGIWVGGQIELKSFLSHSLLVSIPFFFYSFLLYVVIVGSGMIYSFMSWDSTGEKVLLIIGIALTSYCFTIWLTINHFKKEYVDWGKPCKEQIVLMKVFKNERFSYYEQNLIKQAVSLCRNLEGKEAYNIIRYIPIRKLLFITELYELAAYCSLDASDRKKLIDHLTEGITYFKTDSNLSYMRAIAYSLADQPEEAYNGIHSAIEIYNLYPSNRKYDIFSQQSRRKYESALDEYKAKLNFNPNWGFSVGAEGLEYLKKLNSEQIYYLNV